MVRLILCLLPGLLSLWPTPAAIDERPPGQPASAVKAESQRDLEQRLNVRIETAEAAIRVPLPTGAITAAPIGSKPWSDRTTSATATVATYRDRLVREFSVYPAAFVRRVQLKRIVICEQLAFAGQQRAAVPDFAHNVLYLDWQSGFADTNYQRAVMHHEFFHLVDYRDDGRVYQDDAWQQLNPAGFAYGPGGAQVQEDRRQSRFRQPTRGFLTHYATSGVEEDKAELFAHLLVNPEHVSRCAAEDAVLDRKVVRLKALLRSFCGELDGDFWQQVTATAQQRREFRRPAR